MKYKVGFSDGALIDVRNAHSWYEEKVPGLGIRFADAVKRQSQSLESLPEKYRVVRNDIHVCSIPKFPFELYYRIEKSQVVVLVVHAVRQDPKSLETKFNER